MLWVTIGIWITVVLIYGIWFFAIKPLKMVHIWLGGITAGIILLLLVTGILPHNILVIILHALGIAIYAIMIECDKKEKGIIILQAFVVVICMDELIGSCMKLLKLNSENDRFNCLIENNLIILLFLLAVYLKKKWKTNGNIRNKKIYRWPMYFGSCMLVMAVYLAVSGFQFMAGLIDNKKIYYMIQIFTFFAYICIGCLIMVLSYVFELNKKYKNLLEKYDHLFEMQRNRYKEILSQHEETKRYRHDMQNHFMCLGELAGQGEVKKVQEYVMKLEENLQTIRNKAYATGNDVIDAVLNYYIPMLDEEVRVNVEGVCAPGIALSDVELCTVVSNLMQNAQEALNRSKAGNRYLTVEFENGKEYVRIRVINSICGEAVLAEANQIPRTTKRNSLEHGFGIRNVKRTVEENDGLFDMEEAGKEFIATVLLPLMEL